MRSTGLCAIIIFFSAVFSADAQSIYISEPQKISTELVGFDILGKNRNGDVLIYKKYRFEDEIDVYDKQMNLHRSKDITIKNMDYETVEVEKSSARIFHFYTYKQNKTKYLEYQAYNSNLEKTGDPHLVDSTSARLGDNFSEFRIDRSTSGSHMLIYKYEFSNGKIDRLFTVVLNEEGETVKRTSVEMAEENFNPELIKAEITEEGQPVFLFSNDDFSCKKEKGTTLQYRFIFPGGGNNFLITDITNNDFCLREMNYDIDNINSRVVATAFLSEDRDAMLGYNFFSIDVTTGTIQKNNTFTFSQEMLDEMAGSLDKSVKYLPTYQITSLVPRMDGGALIAAEYYDKTVENYEYTNYDPYYGYRTSTRQVEFYEYDDILLLSIDPEGNLNWNNVIRKKQMSREDKGINSSFSMVNAKQRVLFIFNEDVTQNTNVLQYEMLSDGSLDRKSLFNANQQEVQIRPAAAKQVAFNEIIIPSIYKKDLAFVKLVF